MSRERNAVAGALAAASFVAVSQILTLAKPDSLLWWAVGIFAVCFPMLGMIWFGLPKAGDGRDLLFVSLLDFAGFALVFFHFGWLPGSLFIAASLISVRGIGDKKYPFPLVLKALLECVQYQLQKLGEEIGGQKRLLWIAALAVSFLLSVLAAFHGGYIGPDYTFHLMRMFYGRYFEFSAADPPIYIMLGHALFWLIGDGFVVTLSIIQAAINTLALWCFFLYSERRFKSPVVHLALVFFLTFLPVRVIHAATLGTDWMTIPVFVLLLYLFERVLSEKGSTVKNAAFLGLALALGIWSKYSFLALLPAVFVILAFYWWRGAWTWQRFVTICALSLVLPSALMLYSHRESTRVKDAMARTIWLNGRACDMDYQDLFSVKAHDAQLFKAPEAFKSEIGAPHAHSYLGLSHYGIFTDPMNLFQDLNVPQPFNPHLKPDLKMRRPWKTPVMVVSMSLGVLWTLGAVIGTAWALFRAIRNLWKAALEREDSPLLLGTAYFLLMFLPIPFVFHGALFGYWTPRLILPALLCFSLAAFLFVDRKIARGSGKIASVVVTLVAVQSVIGIIILA